MFITGENYHIYNRGAHKAPIFLDKNDYERFMWVLYLANNVKPLRLKELDKEKIYLEPREKTLVDVIAYCLMPNHFHIVLREKTGQETSKFIHKVCTSYSMYYNKKYDHSGTIFQGQFKTKHVDNDDYFRYLIQYVHLNPYGIEEPDMSKPAKNEHLDEAIEYSKTYEYSSFRDYLGEKRPQGVILG